MYAWWCQELSGINKCSAYCIIGVCMSKRNTWILHLDCIFTCIWTARIHDRRVSEQNVYVSEWEKKVQTRTHSFSSIIYINTQTDLSTGTQSVLVLRTPIKWNRFFDLFGCEQWTKRENATNKKTWKLCLFTSITRLTLSIKLKTEQNFMKKETK